MNADCCYVRRLLRELLLDFLRSPFQNSTLSHWMSSKTSCWESSRTYFWKSPRCPFGKFTKFLLGFFYRISRECSSSSLWSSLYGIFSSFFLISQEILLGIFQVLLKKLLDRISALTTSLEFLEGLFGGNLRWNQINFLNLSLNYSRNLLRNFCRNPHQREPSGEIPGVLFRWYCWRNIQHDFSNDSPGDLPGVTERTSW